MSAAPIGVGFIGAGVISDTYLENLTSFPGVRVLRIADLDLDRAAAQAAKHGVPASGTVDELLADDDIQIVVNLTIPAVHAEIAERIVAAGKHVWGEKPFALDRESGRHLLEVAKAADRRVASAPDTILGAGLQSGQRAIAEGRIGTPISGLAIFQSPGPESWHPSPEFLFAKGAGPLFDIGPYYLTALVQVFGPVSSVTGAGGKARATRVIGSGPKAGTEFPVEVPTNVTALLSFESGASAQVVLSFDSKRVNAGVLEITGTEGTLVLPDPNNFDGESTLYTAEEPDGLALPATGHGSSRGTGVAELADAIAEGRQERASGDLAFHVLDVMVSIADSIERGETVRVTSTAPAPLPLPETWDPTAAAR